MPAQTFPPHPLPLLPKHAVCSERQGTCFTCQRGTIPGEPGHPPKKQTQPVKLEVPQGLPKRGRAWGSRESGLRQGAASPFAPSGRWHRSGEKFVCAPSPGFAGVGTWPTADPHPSGRNPAVLLCSSLPALWRVRWRQGCRPDLQEMHRA